MLLAVEQLPHREEAVSMSVRSNGVEPRRHRPYPGFHNSWLLPAENELWARLGEGRIQQFAPPTLVGMGVQEVEVGQRRGNNTREMWPSPVSSLRHGENLAGSPKPWLGLLFGRFPSKGIRG
jgi:hypothetical protein